MRKSVMERVPHLTSDMADNILPATYQSEPPQTAKRPRLDSDHAGLSQGCSSPPCPLGGAVSPQEEDSSSVPQVYSLGTHWLSNHDKVLEALNRLRLSGTLCDVTLCCEGQEFLCHRAVLASLSSYFEAMFTSGSKESTQDRVTITGVDPQVMGLLVDYAYTSTVSTSNVDVQALLVASDLLEFTAVSDNMKRYMDATNCGGAGVPTMKFVLPSHPEKVLEGLDRLRLNDTLCDVTLCCEGREFPCHRSVLASFSSYFEAMFTSGMKESTQDRVTIGGVEPQVMDVLLDYAYTCEVSITTTITKTGVKHSNVKALLAASDLFDVTAVRELCCKNMEADVDIKNCPLGGAVSPQEEDSSSVPQIYSLGTHWLSNHDKVLEALNRLRLSGTLCDVTLCCEGQEFLCHRAVLASLSSYFEAMFISGSKESTQDRVTITGVDPQVMGLLVDYAYTSTVSTSNVDVQALLAASDLLEFTAVSDNMKRYMDVNNCGGAGVPTMKFVLPSHPEKVLEGLDRLRLNDTLCDVTLCCEGQEFPCHRSVLASFSSYFEAMFTSGMKESTQDRVTIGGVEPQVMDVLLDYAYTCEVSITTTITKTGVKHSNVKALLAASDLFDVTAVRELCCENMEAAVDLKNCVETYCFAEAHSCESLKKRSMDLILEDFRVLYQQEEFLSLPMERVSEILSSDHLNVPNEDTVLHAAMQWLKTNPTSPTRTQNFKKVFEFMQQVRLPLVTPSLLPGVMKCLAVLEVHEGCQGLLSRCDTTRPRRRTVIVTVGAKRPGDGAKLESFDPLTKEWKTVGQLPLELYNPALLASGSTLYLAGEYGHAGPNMPWAMWRYDPPHSSWLKMSHTKEKRAQSRLVVLDGWLFAVGGRKYEKSGDSIERYDSETDTWHLMESVGMEEHYNLNGLVVALDRHLYFIGGALHGWYSSPVQVAKYNPKTSVWTQLATMQIPRDMAAACVLNGKIYVTGGHWTHENNELLKQAEDSVECYTPQTDQWSTCAPMGAKRYGHSMAVVDGKMYVLGGMDVDYVQDDGVGYHYDIECYCEETDTWETVGELPAARYGLRCASLKLRNDHGQPIDDDDESEDDSTDDEDDDDDWRSPNPSYLYSNSHRHMCSEDDREDLMFLRNFF